MPVRTVLGMTFELKRIAYSDRLSEETAAYAADLYVDGKILAHVKNDGHGGSDHAYPAKGRTHDEINALDKRMKTEAPKYTLKISDTRSEQLDYSLEMLCSELLEASFFEKEVKRVTKSRILWINDKGELMQSAKLRPDQMKPGLNAYKAKHPTATFLNELPIERQVALYRELAA